MSKERTIISVDLGTTNSAVAVYQGGEPIIISNAEGKRTTPSVIGFTDSGEIKVGDAAKRQAVTNPEKTIYSIKRFIGKNYDACKNEITKVPYKVSKNSKGNPVVNIGDREYTPQEISAMILQKMKKTAEDYLGHEVERAIITVPAFFGQEERTATMEAGKIAGLKVERIINEPTAASLAYGMDKKDNESKILVFDIGGGTSDISILEIGDGVFEVKSTDGDVNLGGDDFDNAIINWLVEEFKADTGVDLRKDLMAFQRLKEAAEKAKIELSSSTQTDINLPYITSVDNQPQHMVKMLTRAKFEQMTKDLVDRTLKCAKNALKNAKMKASDIDEIILVGGSTRIPALQEAIEKLIGKKANKSINPDEVVALGASVQGAVLTGEVDDILLLDVIPLSIGIETMGGVFTKLIEANTTVPTKKSQVFSTAQDNQPSVSVRIAQGERNMFDGNKFLGTFHLDGVPPAPRGVPQIEISVDVDANSVMTVTAKDKGTGKENHIRIEGGGQLTDEEIEKMRKDAEENAERDRLELEKIEKMNAADSMIYQTEKSIKEFGEKLTEEEKTSIEERISALKTAHSEERVDDLESLMEEVNNTWMPITTRIYQENQTAEEATVSEEDDVQDATYEEVK